MTSLEELEQKAKNIKVMPSQMPIEGYVRLKMYCVCCRHKISEKGEFRIEDAKKMMEIDKPVCQNCANFLKRWQKDREENYVEKQKLKEIIEDIPSGFFSFSMLPKWNELIEKLEELIKESKG